MVEIKCVKLYSYVSLWPSGKPKEFSCCVLGFWVQILIFCLPWFDQWKGCVRDCGEHVHYQVVNDCCTLHLIPWLNKSYGLHIGIYIIFWQCAYMFLVFKLGILSFVKFCYVFVICRKVRVVLMTKILYFDCFHSCLIKVEKKNFYLSERCILCWIFR